MNSGYKLGSFCIHRNLEFTHGANDHCYMGLSDADLLVQESVEGNEERRTIMTPSHP
jgi:hypothetical protein